jgi:HEAT repeat protein
MQKLLIPLAVIFALAVFETSATAQKKSKKPAAAATEKKRDAPSAARSTNGKKIAQTSKKRVSGKSGDIKKPKTKKKTKKQTKKEAAKAAAEAEKRFSEALTNLKSENPAKVLEAVQLLGTLESEDVDTATPLMDLLKSGPRSDITDAAIFTLGAIGNEASAPLLMTYLKHRRPDARIAALFALERFKTKEVTESIEGALRDSDRQVRASAALALGKRGDVASVPILFRAFERGVTDAAISIGQLGSPDDAKRLISYLGKEDIKVLLAGFEEFLHRDDFPENAKLTVLNRLFDLAGPEVWRFAVAYKESFPPDTQEEEDKVYKLVCRMVRQIKDKK